MTILLDPSVMTLVEDPPAPEKLCRDPDDDRIIAAARAGGCRLVITGDRDLLVLRRHKGLEFVAPADFWRYEAKAEAR